MNKNVKVYFGQTLINSSDLLVLNGWLVPSPNHPVNLFLQNLNYMIQVFKIFCGIVEKKFYPSTGVLKLQP